MTPTPKGKTQDSDYPSRGTYRGSLSPGRGLRSPSRVAVCGRVHRSPSKVAFGGRRPYSSVFFWGLIPQSFSAGRGPYSLVLIFWTFRNESSEQHLRSRSATQFFLFHSGLPLTNSAVNTTPKYPLHQAVAFLLTSFSTGVGFCLVFLCVLGRPRSLTACNPDPY